MGFGGGDGKVVLNEGYNLFRGWKLGGGGASLFGGGGDGGTRVLGRT